MAAAALASVVAAATVTWASPATAVVPRASQAERLLAGGLPTPTATVVEWQERGPDDKPTTEGRLTLAPDQVSLVSQDLTTLATQTSTWTGGRGALPVGGHEDERDDDERAALPLTSAPAWVRLLAGSPPREVVRSLGVDRRITSLELVEHTVLVVVGAGPRQRDVPQLHLERETGRLRRVIERRPPGPNQPAPGPLLDVRLDGVAGEDPLSKAWPARIEVTEGDKTRVLHVTAVRAPAPPPPLPTEPALPPAQGSERQGQPAPTP